MHKLFLFVLLNIIISSSFAQTQASVNEDAINTYKKADKALNNTYQKILKSYSADTAFIKNLKKAQKIWIQFRDAEIKAKYPEREPGYYGSMQPVCWYSFLTGLTQERTKQLQVWLAGIAEGDGCAGSVKSKN